MKFLALIVGLLAALPLCTRGQGVYGDGQTPGNFGYLAINGSQVINSSGQISGTAITGATINSNKLDAATVAAFQPAAANLTNWATLATNQIAFTLWHDGLVTCGATETAISTNNLPAGILAANGQAIEYVLNGTNSAGSARTMAIYVFYGAGHDYVVQSTSTAAGAWEAHIRIVRVSASVVDVYTWGQIQGAVSNINRYTDTGSTAVSQPLSVTIQGAVAGDIACRWGTARWMP